MLPLTDGLLKMMNFNNVFRWHVPFLFLFLFTCRAMAAVGTATRACCATAAFAQRADDSIGYH